tara:strand:- start:163 stop:813 length:651 start_codon:yes stop_codon:yes gene_type:complete
MTIKIAPSVLAADFNHLMDEVNLVDKAGCDYIHCDIMDGHFVPNISFGPDIVKKIRSTTNKILDVHLMINPVLPYIKKFVEAGADIISFHIEADNNPLKIINEIKNQNLKVGIAIKPNTPLSAINEIIKDIDLILIMTVEPGFGGQKFISSQLQKINEAKNLIKNNNLNIDIQVDGGINKETAKSCVENGANVLVAGSYIFNAPKSEYSKKIKTLR